MSTDAQLTRTLSDHVAEEVRVALVRRRMSGRELARKLQVSASWVSYRLTGAQPIDLNDLQRMAEALGIHPTDLLPRKATDGYPTVRRVVDPLAERVIATVGQPAQRATLIPRPIIPARRLGHPRRPDRSDHRRRPVTTVAANG